MTDVNFKTNLKSIDKKKIRFSLDLSHTQIDTMKKKTH